MNKIETSLTDIPLPAWFHKVTSWRTEYQNLLIVDQRRLVSISWIINSCEDLGTVAGQHQITVSGGHLIRLSPWLSQHEAYETYGHEFAHLCDFILNKRHGHSKSWKAVMVRFGLPPHSCHMIPLRQRKAASKILGKIDRWNRS